MEKRSIPNVWIDDGCNEKVYLIFESRLDKVKFVYVRWLSQSGVMCGAEQFYRNSLRNCGMALVDFVDMQEYSVSVFPLFWD